MSLQRSEFFIKDVESQYEWYARNAGDDVADRYLEAIAATCTLIERQPLLGPMTKLTNPRVAGWRFFVVIRPFHRHVLFYEVEGNTVIMRRAQHGHRQFPKRLIDPPGAG
jgi:plasmid stabilization system protein ParE